MSTKNNALDSFARGLAEWMIRLRWLVMIAAVAAASYIATSVDGLSYNNNYRAFFSEDNPELKNFEEFQATYTKSDNILFVVVPRDGSDIFSNDNLAAIDQLTEGGWQLPFASRVDSVTNFQHTYAVGDELIVEDLVPEPGASSDEELVAQKATALGEPLISGLIISPDSRAAIVNVTVNYPEKSLTEVPEAAAAARALRDQVKAAYPQLDIYLSGSSMLNNAFGEAIRGDFTSLIPLLFVIITIMTIIAVRSVTATLATLMVVILSTMVAMGWAGFMKIELAGPSPFAMIMIMTLAIADAIHILISLRVGMRAGLDQRAAVIDAVRINFLPVTITSLTTAIGFLALNFSDSPPFRDFGNITSVGISAAWILSLTFLPAVLVVIPLRVKAVTENDRNNFFARFANFVIGHHRKLAIVMSVVAVTLIAMIPRIELTDETREYFGQQIEFRRDTDEMIKHFGFVGVEFSVKAEDGGSISDPAYLQQLADFTDWLRARDDVAHVASISDIMKRLNKNLHADDADFYRLPDDRDLSAQYLLLFELSLPYGLDLNDRINIDKTASRVTVTMDGQIDSKATREFLKDADAWLAANTSNINAPPTGPQVMFTFIAQRNVESMIAGTTLAIIVISLIMIVALRSLKIGLLSVIPNALPILGAFGIWGLTVAEVGFSVAAVASLSLGIVIDDTVHFLTKFVRARREKNLSGADSIRYAFETVGAAIFFNSIILVSGFAVLMLSSFQINRELGTLTTITILLAFIFDFLLLPGLLLMISRDGKGKTQLPTGDSHGTFSPATS